MKKFQFYGTRIVPCSWEARAVEFKPRIFASLVPFPAYVAAEPAEEMLEALKKTVKELQFCRDEKHFPSKDLIKELQSIIAKAEA